MDFGTEVLRVMSVRVHSPQAVRNGGRVRDGVPVRDARRVGRRGDDIRHGHGPVVAEGLADAAGLRSDAESRDLRVLDRVAVLVEDDFSVLGVIDAALPETQVVVLVPRERVADAVLVRPDVLRFLVDRTTGAAETE